MSRNQEFHTGAVHHITADQLSELTAGDYKTPIRDVMSHLQKDWDHSGEFPGDPDYVHSNEFEHGGPRPYVEHLKADISKNGMREPIDVRRGAVVDGHHRSVAAMELGMQKIPVRYTDEP